MTRTHWFGEDISNIDTTLADAPVGQLVNGQLERGGGQEGLRWRAQIRGLMSHLVPTVRH